MNNMVPGAVAFVAGIVLGAFYFGGLWWTVRKGVVSTRPALWFLGSTILRTGLVLVGFYFVGRGHWERLLVCLLGFIICRVLIMRLTRLTQTRGGRQRVATPPNSEKEVRHAS